MRLSKYYLFTVKDDPSDAHLTSHKLMLRSGMIRQATSGIYSWLPIGVKVLKKIENIIRKMHSEYNVHELLMPTIQSSDLWKKSGRYENYGKEMLRFRDRHDNELLYGPTNEELITNIISKDLKSYKDFPQLLYHIQWKFRDEVRPRFGVMRCREFLMKDAYSFDTDYRSALYTYCKFFILYLDIFNELGIQVLPVVADTGPIGGTLSHEFILETNAGESDIYFDKRIYELNKKNLNIYNQNDVIKFVDQVNKIYSVTSDKYDEQQFDEKVPKKFQRISKGIEVGHIFYFGDKYSDKLNAKFLNKEGKSCKIFSGSYGIGVSRLVAAIIEARNDKKGIVWPLKVSPFKLAILNLQPENNLTKEYCENLYNDNQITDVLYDDRNVRAGDKFNTIDLIGIPYQIIVGIKNLEDERVEIKCRKNGTITMVNKNQVISYIKKNYEL